MDGSEVKPEVNDYVRIFDESTNDCYEIPCEEDNTVLLAKLESMFVGSNGLKYRVNETSPWRVLKVAGAKILSPNGRWGDALYHVIYQKGDVAKRKLEDTSQVSKIPKIETRTTDLVVLGLPFSSSEEDVRRYFEQFGDLVLIQVKRDYVTGNSKGFAFIRFREYSSQVRVIGTTHVIGGRKCWVNQSTKQPLAQHYDNPKVFVGRLVPEITEEDIRELFASYGTILEVFYPKPFRGFAFVTFEDARVAQSLCGESIIYKGTSIFISSAAPNKEKAAKNAAGYYGSNGNGANGAMPPDAQNPFMMMAAYAQYYAQQQPDPAAHLGPGAPANYANAYGSYRGPKSNTFHSPGTPVAPADFGYSSSNSPYGPPKRWNPIDSK